MLINDIVVFKTPLDREYKNVYDAKNFTEYENLISTFPKLVIQNVVERDRKSFGDNLYNFQITVEGYTLSTLKDYNYCAVRIQHSVNNSSWKYYFITDIREITSVPTADTQYGYTEGSILRLTLQYDVWANNISNLANKARYEYCPRRTTKNIKRTDSANKQYSILQGYKDIIATNVVNKKRLFSGVLYLALRYGDAEFYVSGDEQFQTQGIPLNVKAQLSTPIVYLPIYYDSTFFSQYDSVVFYSGSVNKYKWEIPNQWEDLYIPPVYNSNPVNSIFNKALKHTSLLEAYITWFGPNPVNVSYGRYEWAETIYLKADDGTRIPMIVQQSQVNPYNTYNFNYLYDSTPFDTNHTDLYGYTQLKDYSDYLQTYPYKNNYSLLINGIEIPLIPTYDKYTFDIALDYVNTTSPRLTLKLNGNTYLQRVLTEKYNVISSIDSLQEYLRNNQSQFTIAKAQAITSAATNAVGFAMNPTIGGAGNLVNNVLSIAKMNARLTDVNRQMDSFSIPSVVGIDNFLIDGIYLIERQVIDEDILRDAWYDYQYYGSYFEEYDNIFANYRHTFDYVQTTNCNLPFIQNPYERKILENIFDSGVTKWHILPATDTIGTSKTFDKTINNYPEVTLG